MNHRHAKRGPQAHREDPVRGLPDGGQVKRRVVIESPLKADTPEGYARNRRYAIACWHHSRSLGESPFASHIFIAQPDLLDDADPEQRADGIEIGLTWAAVAELAAVYCDLGISSGMEQGILRHIANAVPCEERRLPPELLAKVLG